jgi:hypothetical protein
MAGRYLISGVQLGLLKSLALIKDTEEVTQQLDDILTNQFVGNSENSLKEDIKKGKENLWLGKQ